MKIVDFHASLHQEQVVELWRAVFNYGTAHNDPALAIAKKTAYVDHQFFVALSEDSKVIGTVMIGYDGHRGWIYSLAVAPENQRQGIGSQLMNYAESKLAALGCMKINLQIAEGNEKVEAFYQTLGYATEKRISMGKQIPENIND